MPKRLSIEIVEHSLSDVRLIIKENGEVRRYRFRNRRTAAHIISRILRGERFDY